MSTGDSEQQPGLGCFTLVGIILFICWSIEIVFLVLHPPIDFLSLSIYTTLLALYLFLCSPWGRSLSQRSFLIAKSPFLFIIFFTMYLLLRQYPLNSPQMIMGIFTLCVSLFSYSPWFKYTLRWFPVFLIMLILLSGILTTYPVVLQGRMDYFKLFSTLFIVMSMISFLLLFLRFVQRAKGDNSKNINFRLGRTHLLQEDAFTQQKPVVDVHFLGVSLQIFRAGNLTKITISTD